MCRRRRYGALPPTVAGSNGTLSCTGGLAVGTSAAMVEPPGSRELLLYLPI